jgi:creatinine amidohydrolase
MRWEALTATDFAVAVRETGGVCVIAMGVIEKHSEHLPLGTDYLNAHTIACRAAEIEPAVVFPPFYFGQIYEARCFPGTVTLEPRLLLDLIWGVFDEIARNGLRKIVLYNGHGGNNHLVRFLAQSALWEDKGYSLYLPEARLTPERQEAFEKLRDTDHGGHADEVESSVTLANHGQLVKMERVPEEGDAGRPLGRLDHLPPTFTGTHWYSNYPEHYAGDARTASDAKGERYVALAAQTLAEYIAAVRVDEVVPALEREFFGRVDKVGGSPEP